MKAGQIPLPVCQAIRKHILEYGYNTDPSELAAAALAAWPGMEYWPEFSDAGLGEHEPGKVFLPLTGEARDE